MYDHSSAYYDLIYRDLKDYGEEARKIDALLRRIAPQPKRLLDVGCGTGEHAYRLRRDHGYHVDGVDIQAGFVDIARSKSPGARFEIADMRSFELGRRYDAILCLFSSIGYVETQEGLEQALSQFAKHLCPGGWLILEPWVTPEHWQPGQVDTVEATDPRTGHTVQRVRTGSTDGSVSVIEIEYRLEADATRETRRETHRLGLFTKREMHVALTKAGFQAQWLPQGLQSPSMLIAKLTP